MSMPVSPLSSLDLNNQWEGVFDENGYATTRCVKKQKKQSRMFANFRRIPGLAHWMDDICGDEGFDDESRRHNNIVHNAEERLYDRDQAVLAAAEAFSNEALALIVANLDAETIQLDRTHKTTPPASIGLPRQIVHVALASRLLPAPIATAALAISGGGLN